VAKRRHLAAQRDCKAITVMRLHQLGEFSQSAARARRVARSSWMRRVTTSRPGCPPRSPCRMRRVWPCCVRDDFVMLTTFVADTVCASRRCGKMASYSSTVPTLDSATA
jgi:hypothetical protein